MTRQAIFNISARGLILQGSKSTGSGKMWSHCFIDPGGKRCALGFLLPYATYQDLEFTFVTAKAHLDRLFGHFSVDPLALELMRIHNCCAVKNWPALLTKCAKKFELDAKIVSTALQEVAERALQAGVELPSSQNLAELFCE